MTTEEIANRPNLDKLNENIEKIEQLSQRLMSVFQHKRQIPPALQGPGPDLYIKAATAYVTEMMANPSKMLEQQVNYWGETLKHFAAAQGQMTGEEQPPETPATDDPRFSNPMWSTNPYFNFVRHQYQLNADTVRHMVEGVEGLDDKDKQRLEFFSGQLLDLLAPTNFLATNPDALARALETDGQSLVDGLENLVSDLERNDGELLVTLADRDAFEVGRNIATTPGKVVFRNAMFELIQYVPTTEKVHKTPLLIFPPWINKFYVLDLRPENSLIKWIVDQGFTLFVVSWVNPDATYADAGLDTYIDDGYLQAIAAVQAITGEKTLNAVGYCIAGTVLSLTLALLAKRGDKSIKSATYFTALTDFSDQGEFGVFLEDDFVDGIEQEAREKGVLDSFYMSRTFSYLRPNDLIYSPAIKSYMLGEAPPAFDLLYWNGDSTNLPARMTVEYLRELCQDNRFATRGMTILGEKIRAADVKVPACSVACETDHIAAWKDVYRGFQMLGSKDKTFILSQSGHIAGIVNPPAKKKYGHYTNPDTGLTHEDWREGADFTHGSWWPRWGKWLAARSGPLVAAREPGSESHPVLCDTPGTYVTAKPTI